MYIVQIEVREEYGNPTRTIVIPGQNIESIEQPRYDNPDIRPGSPWLVLETKTGKQYFIDLKNNQKLFDDWNISLGAKPNTFTYG